MTDVWSNVQRKRSVGPERQLGFRKDGRSWSLFKTDPLDGQGKAVLGEGYP
jgi:hypothetical protein